MKCELCNKKIEKTEEIVRLQCFQYVHEGCLFNAYNILEEKRDDILNIWKGKTSYYELMDVSRLMLDTIKALLEKHRSLKDELETNTFQSRKK